MISGERAMGRAIMVEIIVELVKFLLVETSTTYKMIALMTVQTLRIFIPSIGAGDIEMGSYKQFRTEIVQSPSGVIFNLWNIANGISYGREIDVTMFEI